MKEACGAAYYFKSTQELEKFKKNKREGILQKQRLGKVPCKNTLYYILSDTNNPTKPDNFEKIISLDEVFELLGEEENEQRIKILEAMLKDFKKYECVLAYVYIEFLESKEAES
ncbi:MAG: hypothetical protein SOW25_04270 [Helicobacter sp.]|nr:hypothetical protein [Helicobacteraceae bacterium]MDY3113525.1 hypothetical protein [Helicobacter sp.]